MILSPSPSVHRPSRSVVGEQDAQRFWLVVIDALARARQLGLLAPSRRPR